MNKIICTSNTSPEVKRLSKVIGKSEGLTASYLGSWQSDNNSISIPSDDEFKDFVKSGEDRYTLKRTKTQNGEYEKLFKDFTPSILGDRVNMLTRDFSNIIDKNISIRKKELKSKLDSAENEEEFNTITEEIKNLNTVQGRQLIVQEIGIKTMFEQIKNIYTTLLDNPKKLKRRFGEEYEYAVKEYQKIVDNFPTLMEMACTSIESTEYMRIIPDFHVKNVNNVNTVELGGSVTNDTNNTEFNDDVNGDNEDGERVTGNNGLSFQVRFIDPYVTMSRQVKHIISSIADVDNDGNYKIDDLGNIKYMNPEYIHIALLSEMSKIIDSDDFVIKNEKGEYSFPALERMAEKYNWVNQIINELYSNKYLIGLFYSDLRQDFIPYWMQHFNEEKGIWETIMLNESSGASSTIARAVANYKQNNPLTNLSIFTKNGAISISNAREGVKLMEKVDMAIEDNNFKNLKTQLSLGLKMLGIDTNESAISNLLRSKEGNLNLPKLVDTMSSIFKDVQDYDENIDLFKQFESQYKIISEIVGVVSEIDRVASFRQGKKTRQSYSAPNKINTMIKTLKDEKRYKKYIEDEFKSYEFFWKDKLSEWRIPWIEDLYGKPDEKETSKKNIEAKKLRDSLALKELIYIEDVEYEKWTPAMIQKAFVNEYFSIPKDENSDIQYGYYSFPIYSDSPVAQFIKFRRYTGTPNEYVPIIVDKLKNVVYQELWRIDLCEKRAEKGVAPIQNFDDFNGKEGNGKKFMFFPELNFETYTKEDGKTISFKERCEELETNGDKEGLEKYIKQVLYKILQKQYKDYIIELKKTGAFAEIVDNLLKTNIISDKLYAQQKLHEYFYNQALAYTQIIQMTITDLAFYKDSIDFQKRYKEVYAAGKKLCTNTTYGKKLRRTAYLEDSIITSKSYADIKKALDIAVEEGRIRTFDRDNILYKFRDITETDAQAYIHPEAMRSIMDMMGNWSDEANQAFEAIINGNWDMSHFNVIWQTIKPFVYSQLSKSDGFGGRLKVPHQNKNSEFLLLAAVSSISASLNKSEQLKALQQYMKDNDIDVVQFKSAVKSGGQGPINLNYYPNKLDKELTDEIKEAAKKVLGNKFDKVNDFDKYKKGNDFLLHNSIITQEEYNNRMEAIKPDYDETYKILDDNLKDEFIHEIPYEDYVIQQPSPEHLIDTESIFGSQTRNLGISDLGVFTMFFKGLIKEGNNTIEGVKELTSKEASDLFKECIVNNLVDDYVKVESIFSNIENLQSYLMSQVKGNSKYSRDMINALQIVERDGRKAFKLPFSFPNMTENFQEIILAAFKNKITKQHIKGGNAILVSDFGLTKELPLYEYDKNGNKIGIPCYLPASSRDFFKPFLKQSEDGESYELDIEKMPEELRKMVGYRIPTEGKYSMLPLVIKGFLPQQNGSAIMLPADITQIAGSDFDIDKLFLMIPEYNMVEYDYKKAHKDFSKEKKEISKSLKFINKLLNKVKENTEEEDKVENFEENFEGLREKLDVLFGENQEEKDLFVTWFEENKESYRLKNPIISKVQYDFTKSVSKNSREQRNNLLIDILFNILNHKDSNDKFLSPGNFDELKIQSRFADIFDSASPEYISSIIQESDYKKIQTLTLIDGIDMTDNQSGETHFGLPKEIANFVDNSNLESVKSVYKSWLTGEFYQDVEQGRRAWILEQIKQEKLIKEDLYYSTDKDLAIIEVLRELSLDEYYKKSMLSEFKKAFKCSTNKDIQKVYSEITKKGDLDTIDSFVKDYRRKHPDRTQLSQNTFVYNHVQNMTGGALIGVYANNTTFQAKYQFSKLQLKDNYTFFINGKKCKSLHNAYIESKVGDKIIIDRISKNCAQFSAASVDNVKDPVLASLLQNMKTAKVTCTMLNLGMSIEEISLMFRQPVVAKLIKTTGDLKDLSKEINRMQLQLKKRGGSENVSIESHEFTSRELLENILEDVHREYEDTSENAVNARDNEILTQQIQALKLFERLYYISDYLSNLVQISRADSPNGAVLNNIAGAQMQVNRVRWFNNMAKNDKKLFPFSSTGMVDIPKNNLITRDMSKEDIIQKLMNRNLPMLQAFYTLGIEMSTKVLEDSFSIVNDRTNKILSDIVDEAPMNFIKNGEKTQEVFQSFYRGLVAYALSKSTLLGDDGKRTFAEKRDWYLNEYPAIYKKVISENPDIAKLGIFKQITVNEKNIIALPNASGMRATSKDMLMQDLDTLLYMDNPEAQKLLEDLFKYSYYLNGFRFGPFSVGNYFSTMIINQFPELIQIIDNINTLDKKDYDRYVSQFYVKNYKNSGIVPYFSFEKNEEHITKIEGEDSYFIDSKVLKNPITGKPYKYIRNKNSLLILEKHSNSTNKYTEIPLVAANAPYNANSSIEELSTLYPLVKNNGIFSGLNDFNEFTGWDASDDFYAGKAKSQNVNPTETKTTKQNNIQKDAYVYEDGTTDEYVPYEDDDIEFDDGSFEDSYQENDDDSLSGVQDTLDNQTPQSEDIQSIKNVINPEYNTAYLKDILSNSNLKEAFKNVLGEKC